MSLLSNLITHKRQIGVEEENDVQQHQKKQGGGNALAAALKQNVSAFEEAKRQRALRFGTGLGAAAAAVDPEAEEK